MWLLEIQFWLIRYRTGTIFSQGSEGKYIGTSFICLPSDKTLYIINSWKVHGSLPAACDDLDRYLYFEDPGG